MPAPRSRTSPPAPRRTAPPAPPPIAPSWRFSAATGLVALAFTLLLTPDVSGDKDAGEFALVLARFGAAHPTGYPLYTLAGGAFVHLLHACGAHWIWAANAWSALGGAVAVALLHALAARLLAREGLGARAANAGGLIAAAALAVHPLWTAATTQAEVHSWHVAWALGALLASSSLLTGRARAAGGEDGPAPGAWREPLGWGVLAGAGLAHHLTSVLVSGPLTLAVALAALRARRWRWPALALVAAGALAPLLAYGFIAWRAFHPAAGQWNALAPNWPSIVAHVTGAQYRIYVGGFSPSGPERELLERDVWPWFAATLPAVTLWALTARRTPPGLRLGVAGAVAASLAFVFLYGVADPSAYFLPPLALSFAVAPAALLLLPGARRAARPLAWAGALLVAFAAFHGVRTGLERAREFRANEALVHRLWRSIAAERGFVLWNDDMISLLHGYQVLGGEKPGLEIVHPVQLSQDWPRAQFSARHGFDPISRAEIAAAANVVHPRNVQELSTMMAGVVALRINAHSPLPVMLFLPQTAEVRVLPKGAAADSLAGAAGR